MSCKVSSVNPFNLYRKIFGNSNIVYSLKLFVLPQRLCHCKQKKSSLTCESRWKKRMRELLQNGPSGQTLERLL